MFRRRSTKPDAINASKYSRRDAIADSLWAFQDRFRAVAGSTLSSTFDAVRWPFERFAFALEERVLWPAGDRAATAGAPARALSYGALVLVAAAAGVAGLIWAAPDRPHQASTPVAATSAPAPLPVAATEQPAEPTLQGAAPVFKPVEGDPSEVDPARAIVKSEPASGSADPSAEASTSAESGTTASSSAAAKKPAVDGPPAGPEAIAVARDFAVAFVSYETGEADPTVRRAFGATATPALAKALLQRPPRLPANVEVPKAKVLNIVPAPSHGGIYPLSVSLLRVGLTSELRLEMEELKGDGWRVTNVLG
jgi:hypothetical protein